MGVLVAVGRPLGFVIDRLNTSAALYRITLCLSGHFQCLQGLWAIHAPVSITEQTPDTMHEFTVYYLSKPNSLMMYDYHVIATLPPTELLRNNYKIPL